MKTLSLALLIASLVIVHESDAWSYACITTSCAPYCQSPVQYKLGKVSDDMGAATSQAQVQTAMEAWTKPACSALKTQFAGNSTEASGNGNGVIAWVEADWQSGTGTIGVTTVRASRGCITSSMVLNGVNFKWVTGAPKARGEVNAFTIIAHEGGHFIGLGHSAMKTAIMTPSYSGGIVPLSDDDQAGVCKIYPGGGGGMVVPSMGTGGAGGSTGAGGAGGSAPVGQGLLCATCNVGADCASGVCLRNDQTGEKFCGQACAQGCPANYKCTTLNNNPATQQCAPVSGSCKGMMAPGGMSAAGGMTGAGGMGGAIGAAGSGAGGAAGSTGGTGGSGGASPPEDPKVAVADGEHCEVNEDCHSNLCLEQDKNMFCSRLCKTNADCVSGFACRDKDTDNVCLPIDSATDTNGASPAGSEGDGGCSIAKTKSSGPHWLLLLAGLSWLLGAQRRRIFTRRNHTR